MYTPPKPSGAPLKEEKGSGIVRVFLRRPSCGELLEAPEDEIEVPREPIVRSSSLINPTVFHYLKEATEERNVIGPFLQCAVE
jgi:hypothetical protein